MRTSSALHSSALSVQSFRLFIDRACSEGRRNSCFAWRSDNTCRLLTLWALQAMLEDSVEHKIIACVFSTSLNQRHLTCLTSCDSMIHQNVPQGQVGSAILMQKACFGSFEMYNPSGDPTVAAWPLRPCIKSFLYQKQSGFMDLILLRHLLRVRAHSRR